MRFSFLLLCLLLACGSDGDPTVQDASRTTADPATRDAATRDAAPLDARAADAATIDAALIDATPDAAPVEASARDAGSPDGYLELALANGENCAISGAHELICWGTRAGAYLGGRPALIATDTGKGHWRDWEHVYSGSGGTCATRDGGKLYCWHLPASLNAPSADPYVFSWPTRMFDWSVQSVSIAEQSYCAVLSDGSLWCWGLDAGGQLGVGAPTSFEKCGANRCSKTPVRVGSARDWTFVTGVDGGHCGVRAGELYCWGLLPQLLQSYEAETCTLEDPTYPATTTPCTTRPTRVFADFADFDQATLSRGGLCARRQSGELVCRFQDTYNGSAPGPTPAGSFTRVAVGDEHGCVVGGGRLHCWGDNERAQLGDGVLDHMAACWPSDDCSPQPVEVPRPDGVDWAFVDAVRDFACALDARGRAFCWGENTGNSFGNDRANDYCGGSKCSRVPLEVGVPYRCDLGGEICLP